MAFIKIEDFRGNYFLINNENIAYIHEGRFTYSDKENPEQILYPTTIYFNGGLELDLDKDMEDTIKELKLEITD